MRLIRSKGVGCISSPSHRAICPMTCWPSLGLRIQHGLRAFTAKEQKSLRAVADGFRPNPAFDALSVLTELGIGEALVGTLQDKGTPEMVQRVLVAPPQSRIGPLTETERTLLIAGSPFKGRYDKPIDRESAYEILMGRKGLAPEPEAAPGKTGGAGAEFHRASRRVPRHGRRAGVEIGDATGGQSAGPTIGARLDGVIAGRQQTPLSVGASLLANPVFITVMLD